MAPTLEENLKVMEKCPRFQSCSIPKCPLDYFMSDRTELVEDEKCILITQKQGKIKKDLIRGKLMKLIGKYIWVHNRRGSISYPDSIVSGVKGGVGKFSEK